MAKSMFTNNDSSTELAWEVLKKQQACWHTDYCKVSCEECENYVIHRDLEKAIDIIIEEKNKSNKKSEWIEIPRYGGDFFSKCPKCGALEIAQTNFCPECGEAMKMD